MTQVNVLSSQPHSLAAPLCEPVTLSVHDEERLRLLDSPEEWAEFSHPDAMTEGSWSSSVVFEGMHCAACLLYTSDAADE